MIVGHYEKTKTGWVPHNAITERADEAYKIGDVCRMEIKKPRSIKQHNKFFAFLSVVYNNQELYPSMPALLTDIKLKVGHFDKHVSYKLDKETGVYVDKIVYIPKSVSFSAMDQVKFMQFMDRAYDVVLDEIIPDMNRPALERAVEDFEARGSH